ncbi:MAG: extracellular solute-binding protein [Chloroflexi bacterium]|nr:extracellular solute-binding protein [Chloroflexota bacterium]
MGRNLMLVLGPVAIVSLALLACSGGGELAERPAAPTGKSEPGSPARPGWEQDWERTVAQAKKEGTVVVYSGYGSEWRAAMTEPMLAKYGINVDILTATSSQVSQRVMREQQTNINIGDVVVSGSSTFFQVFQNASVLQPMDGVLVLPEVVDPKAWWEGKLPWMDPDRRTAFYFYTYVSPPVTINTDLVKPDEMKSWKGLLSPKLKGRIVINDPTAGGGGGQKAMMMLGFRIMDWDFVREVIEQEPVLSRDDRMIVEWIARGKYPLSIDGSRELIFNWTKEGAPLLQVVPSEGGYVTSGTGNVYFPKGSPHPNAAKVFINFLLSKEGQTLSSRATGHQSSRIDVPSDHVDPIVVRQSGVGKYVSSFDPDFLAKQDELTARVVEMFKPLVAK